MKKIDEILAVARETLKMQVSFMLRPELTEEKILKENIPDSEGVNKVVLMVERADTAAASLKRFFITVEMLQKQAKAIQPRFVTITSIGLRLGGRSGRYHLYWFPSTNKIFAADDTDKSVVYTL